MLAARSRRVTGAARAPCRTAGTRRSVPADDANGPSRGKIAGLKAGRPEVGRDPRGASPAMGEVMTRAIHAGLALNSMLALYGAGIGVAACQDGASGAGAASPDASADGLEANLLAVTTPYDEEVVVRGGRSIWRQLERAEDAFFDRFNAINSNDDFDISCRMRAELGTTIKKRECRANFWRDEDANAARDTLYRLQGSYAGDEALAWHIQQVKSGRMLEEMARLAREDPELEAALERLVDLRRRLETAPVSSRSREVVPPDGQAMPFEASLIVHGRVGRGAWTHSLTDRTFTFADVDGDIYEIEAACAERAQSFRYQADVEWTLPDAWGACELVVEASRGTSFYLLEFGSPDPE